MGKAIYGTEYNDSIALLGDIPELAQDNEIYAYGGDDEVYGHGGNDVIFCGLGNDIAEGSEGLDVLFGEDGDDKLWGGEGDDWLVGGTGDDKLYGNEDNDLLVGGSGGDLLHGGDGEDTVNYGDSLSSVVVNLRTGVGSFGTADGDTFFNIENVDGSDYEDTLVGNDVANELHGAGGDDHLFGGGGNDKLYGGYGPDGLFGGDGDDSLWGHSGDDKFEGGAGADDIVGGDGNDTAFYLGSTQGVTASLIKMSGQSGDAEGDTFWNVENLKGSAHTDELTGDDGVNTLDGWKGDDWLYGLGGADTLEGDDGRDHLDGGEGIDKMAGGLDDDDYVVDHSNDEVIEAIGEGFDLINTKASYALAAGSEVEVLEATDTADTTAIDLFGNEFGNILIGNGGDNVLVGGLGLDFMTGHGGEDAFVWTSTAETDDDAVFADVVTDFVAGLDVLDVSAIDANPLNGAIDDQFEFIGETTNFTAVGQIGYVVSRGMTHMVLNTDGDGDVEGVIAVVGEHAVDVGWFNL